VVEYPVDNYLLSPWSEPSSNASSMVNMRKQLLAIISSTTLRPTRPGVLDHKYIRPSQKKEHVGSSIDVLAAYETGETA